ncbi:MAG: M4 family metallopeptidase, partial [bacterium]
MKKIIGILMAVFVGLGVIIFPVLAEEENRSDLTLEQGGSYEKLSKKASNLYLDWDDLDNVPDFIRMTDLNIDWQSDNYRERTYQFLEEYRELYKINPDSDVREELKVIEEEQDDMGMTHITLQQEHQGVPVYAGKLKFHFRANGTISSINGTYLPDISQINPEPAISQNQAVEIAKNQIKQKLDLNDEDFEKLDLKNSAIELLIYNNGLFSKHKESTYLTWKVSIYSEKMALNQLFYINAHDGSIINNLNNIFEARDREVYVMSSCWNFPGTLTYDESGLIDVYDDQAELVYDYSGYVYDYYQSKFTRDSYNGGGGTLESITHYSEMTMFWPFCSDYENASWDPNLRLIRYGDNYITLDVAGHETTHAVIQYTAELQYQNESGALNESYADIFGEFLEEYAPNFSIDWLHRAGHQDGANRSLINPPDYNQPDHTDDQCDENNDYCGYLNDNGGVHTNSGIPNKVAYLIAVGGNHNNIQVNGIGITAAENFYYNTLSIYLIEDSDFEGAYRNTMTACLDFHEGDPITYPMSHCESVFQAFRAVGINTDASFLEVNIEASPPDGYAPLTVDFDGSGSIAVGANITNYDWDFDDNNIIGNGVNVSHEYSDPGSYDVVLTVTDDANNSSSATYQLEVFNPIQPYFIVSGDGVPAPATVDFDASATYDVAGNITDYSWNYGDGDSESTGLSPYASHEYTTDGYYNVTLTVIDDLGYTNEYRHSVTIGNTGPTYVSGTVYNDTWTADRSPYIITSSLSVADDGTLTLEDGVVVKFQSSSTTMTVNGTLNASGTENNPTVFTSYRDDEYGGDANADGNATVPAAGDWRQIIFENSSTATIDNAIV